MTSSVLLAAKHLPPSFDPDSTACLDISYKVTFVSKNWLLKHLFDQKISTIFTSLKVRKIDVSKDKSVEFAALFLYFFGKNNTEELVHALL